MSVRMIAKLCACTCGGAVIGGGAVHVAENPAARPSVVAHSASTRSARGSGARYASAQRHASPRHSAHGLARSPTQTVSRMIIPPVRPPAPAPVAVASSSGGGVRS